MKSTRPESESKTKTRIFSIPSFDGGDDDDFQNPSEALAISQNLILSSLRNPNPQPLKPSNRAPPLKKRQKRAAVSNGKENRRSSRSRVSRVADVCNGRSDVRVYELEERKAEGDERGDFSALKTSMESNLMEILGNGEKSTVDKIGDFSGVMTQNESNLVEVVGNGNGLLSDFGDFDDGEKSGVVGEETQSTFVSEMCNPMGDGFREENFEVVREETQCSFVSDTCNQMSDSIEKGNLCLLTRPDSLDALEGCQNGDDLKNVEVAEVISSLGIDSSVKDGCDDFEVEPVESLQSEEFGSEKVKGCDVDKCLKAGKASFYSMSIESRLLGSRVRSSSLNGGDCGGEFELGTQLNVLMDLCEEVGEGSLSNGDFSCEGNGFGVESAEIGRNVVECPLCGTDITHLSEEMRQVHTNDCLDKDDTGEVPMAEGAIKSDAPQQVADVNPVLDWLRTLGLSKYEEAFIKEEVDWETLKWLTEEDLLSIGIVALGPRKKIVHALNELRQTNHSVQGIERDIPNISVENSKASVSANKLITQYFQGPAIHRNKPCSLLNSRQMIDKPNKDSILKKAGPRSNSKRGKFRDTPPWCCIPGTPFRVDAFRFLRGDCSHWFLTHFHMDHYQGLTKNFCHGMIYCSSITAHLVNMKIGVPWERLQILPLNQKVNVAGVNLTCLDANHCPGSIIILFEPPNDKAVLHTGDFRFSAEMASSSVLQSCRVHTLILDTTYCNPQYDFPKQEAVIQFVIEAIQAEAFNPKTLFLIGSYTIGKERLFLEVGRLLRKKVYVGAAKLRLLRCLGLPEEDMQWFTANETESHIHVVPMWTIASFKRMKHISHQYSKRFNLIVAFSPTGWTFGKGKKKTPGRRWQQGAIIRYEVPYSEHSSFTELKEFVRFISPEHIIPSVNNEGPESSDAMLALLMSNP